MPLFIAADGTVAVDVVGTDAVVDDCSSAPGGTIDVGLAIKLLLL